MLVEVIGAGVLTPALRVAVGVNGAGILTPALRVAGRSNDSKVFFMHNELLTYANTAVFKLLELN
ncbi:MAG: hypothetical protein PUD17_00725 [Treponema sp.]|uniref:hypothetical protein n=1 Tax=Treponema sp. TaxID=166 RepID=UPI00298E8C29|nr:hypothetical protein [Treponema sp.]MDD5810601.1 hypothetical protein [Treponema sp.]